MSMIVDGILDRKFFTLLGRYTATCAHIEAELWKTTLFGKSAELSNDKAANQAMRDQSRLDDLIKAAVRSADDKPEPIQAEIAAIASQIKQDKWIRHMAIHGHWRVEDDKYCVTYFRNFGTRKCPEWKNRDGAYTFSELLAALAGADSLLQRVLDVSESIRRDLRE